jgi:hypothetical protein
MNTISALAVALSLSAQPAHSVPSAAAGTEGDVAGSLVQVAEAMVDTDHDERWFDGIEDARVLRRISETA